MLVAGLVSELDMSPWSIDVKQASVQNARIARLVGFSRVLVAEHLK